MDELQRKVTASQESSSHEVVAKLQKRTYQFKKKGNEAQFTFNTTVEEHIEAAKRELGKLTPGNEKEQATTKRAAAHLHEGLKAIACRQKHKDH